ncbi:hypothetical protein F2P81_002448 [Scophthalmus maximus]|uniref:Ig-like domain-containing protein n=1 Tax=Scophthalmus maximus TaxID=52904 RepID=A0A6A4TM51_SCOMX|nr:hypothetical protein F2P81_002448 [Scophthalmus maximus]
MKPFITSHLLDVRSEQRESGEQCDLVYQYGQGFENGCDSRFRLQVQTDDRERDCFPSSDQVNTSRQWELHLSVFKSYRNICTPPQHHCGSYPGINLQKDLPWAFGLPAGVLQVTWQRLFKDDPIENLATYSKRFGEQVNLPFRGKVALTQASLNSTSITLRNVSWQDESCYICSFNVYPDGSSRKQTCLSVRGISSVDTLHDHRSGPEGEHVEVVFGCSATGKPAPTIEWDISPGASHLDQTETTTASNSDHTFTSSHNVTLQVPADWSGHVDCLLNRGQTGEKQKRIPFSLSAGRPKAKDDMIEGSGSAGIYFSEVTAPVSLTAEAGRPFLLGCNITTATGDTVRQVRWLNRHNKVLMAYEQSSSAPVRISHHDASVQLTGHHSDSSHITITRVRPEDEGCYRCIFDVFPGGSQEGKTCITVAGKVWLLGNKTVISGKPVTLSCWYSLPERVQQVLWRKTAEQGDTTTMASYSKYGHHRVEEYFRGRVSLSRTLDDTQLTIQPVKTEDEACYTCEFHTYPDGSRSATACLSVYVLPKPEVSHVTSSSGVTEANCTAQSRPAADITWNIGGDNRTVGPPISSAYDQGDGTTVVTSTVFFQSGLLSDLSVKCIVHHQGLEKPLTLPLNTNVGPVMVVLLSVCGVAAVLLLCLCVCLCKCLICTNVLSASCRRSDYDEVFAFSVLTDLEPGVTADLMSVQPAL